MTSIITIPAAVDETSFEQVISRFVAVPPDAPLIVDARGCTVTSPYALTSLLALAQSRGCKPTLRIPDDVALTAHWSRAGFFDHAPEVYVIEGRLPLDRGLSNPSETIVMTKVHRDTSPMDNPDLVSPHVYLILRRQLSFTLAVALDLDELVLNACVGVINHSGSTGWLMMQAFDDPRRQGGSLATVAIADSGADCWEDAARRVVIDELMSRAQSRDCKLNVRSGSFRRSVVPAWDDDLGLMEGLAPFPGTQLQFTFRGDAPSQETRLSWARWSFRGQEPAT